jgi:ABC-type branched-subunit amino acid transport system substrate-binding protein/predicted negative regulator of RcsB-dependent stress response
MRTHRAIFRFWVCACFAGVALAGCSGTARGPDIGRLPQLTSDDPAAEAEFREAQALAAHGQRSQAIEHYRAFLHKRPDDRLVPLVQLGLGRCLLEQHADGEALALFASVAEHPEPAVAEQGRFYGGIADERLGRHAEAIEALAPMHGRTIDPADTILLLSTLASAYAAESRYADAIRAYAWLLDERLPDADREAARARMSDLIDHKASPADIRRLLDELDKNNPAFRLVAIRALRDADAARDSERARELVAVLKAQHVVLDEELSAIALRSERAGGVNPNAVGVILSLSGRARRIGELALRGVMLAANLPPNGPTPPDAPSVIFRDDAGDPLRAVQAVEELATVHRVIAIIGPMDGQIALAAGKRAQELGVPLIALTPAGATPSLGSMVFRYFPTPDAEARALAAAAKARGAESFAVLYPENAYGQAMLVAFRREAEAVGLRMAVLRSYTASATSFGSEADFLSKSHFDALFVPDAGQQLALIAPALAAAGLWCAPAGQRVAATSGRSITLLAPSVAFNPSVARLAGRYLQGALFAVPFDAQAPEGKSHDFVEHFVATFGSPPDAFAAFAHDAYQLVRAGVDAGATSRSLLANRLGTRLHTDLVAAGSGFGLDREAIAPVQVLELSDSAFLPINSPDPR